MHKFFNKTSVKNNSGIRKVSIPAFTSSMGHLNKSLNVFEIASHFVSILYAFLVIISFVISLRRAMFF